MRRRTRNTLAQLLQEALDDPADARIHLLNVVCESLRSGSAGESPVPELLRVAQQRTHRPGAALLWAAHRLAASGCPLQAHPALSRENPLAALPLDENAAEWLIGLAPELRSELEAVQQRVGDYCEVLARLDEVRQEFSSGERLRWGMAQAAACFNAGLYFEAHEILEGHWLGLPRGAIRQFVQGVIQISVGLHHASEGRFFGAVNLLGRGLEKTARQGGIVLGLDCRAFFPQISAVREQLLARGPLGMRREPLPDIPAMHVMPDPEG